MEGYQLVALPYAFSSLAMVVALPISNDSEPVLADEIITAMPQMPMERKVVLVLPRFKFESMYEDSLLDALQDLGLTAPFVSTYGFCDVVENMCLFIDKVIHKTFIEIHDEGTTAAAVSALIAPRAPPPPEDPPDPVLFLADHPFQFFILDQLSGLVLFEGQMGAPTTNDIPARGRHSDENYWWNRFGATQRKLVMIGPLITALTRLKNL